jgi:hypothetical protein
VLLAETFRAEEGSRFRANLKSNLEHSMNKALFLGTLVLGSGLLMLPVAQSQTATGTAPTVNIGPTVAAKANSPGPSATAKNQSQKSSIGTGQTSVNSSSPASYWTDAVDIDDDATVEDNQFLWDGKRGVLYTYREDDFKCVDGKSEFGKILMAIYSKGNKDGKPVGSGWYVVGLTPGQCGIAKGGTYGCKFDGSGNFTACGAAVVDNKSGDLHVVITKQQK